jgi:peptidoglycan/xylan/chitin deacetylase (PgdA/CDA1 family)/membrane-associated phospholipid phosphatase
MNPTPVPLTISALGRRIRFDMVLKALGTALGIGVFFAAYFALLHYPLFPSVIIPFTRFDQAITLQPLALIPYVSLWPYVALLPALLIDRRELVGFALGCVGLSIVGLLLFLIYPTTTADSGIDWSQHPEFQFIKKADTPGNACPSLHAAFAIFTGLWFIRLLPRLGAGLFAQGFNLVWAGLIVYSTLATRQHVALDALFGALLGAWAAGLNFIFTPPAENARVRRRPLFGTVVVIKICALLLYLSGIPFEVCLVLFLSGGAFLLYEIFVPAAGELLAVHTRFATAAREVWLTIDDGPDPDDTPRLLDLLDQHQARATFFLIGERAARYPALVVEIRRRGHEIGHHTHTHPCATFWCASPARLRRELDDALAVFAATGPAPRRFRAPVGIKNLVLGPALAARELTCIGWSVRSADSFALDPDAVAARVKKQLRPGAIILMHEGPPVRDAVRVAAIGRVLETLAANNYRTVIPAASDLR